MAYTTINKSTDYFNTKLYTGDGTAIGSGGLAITGVGFQPDWVWIKSRTSTKDNMVFDSVRGVQKSIRTNQEIVEDTSTEYLATFGTDGFTLGGNGKVNGGSTNYASWNWKAGGTSPSQTYVVKVVSDSGNKYRFDDFGTSAVTLDLQEGGTYTFDQSDSSNATHPLRFYTAADKTGGEYTTGVTTNGTPGSSGAYTRITVAASAPTLYYQCSAHAAMGGQVNTNSTFGSSNFSGTIQSTVSANSTAGFSIVKYTGTGSNATVGHGLNTAPKIILIKNRDAAHSWSVYSKHIGNTKYLKLDTNSTEDTNATRFNSTDPTSTVFSLGTHGSGNASGEEFIAYCFTDVTGYSKFGSYSGNGNADGTFVYTGFKPAFFLVKAIDSVQDWFIYDNKRETYNLMQTRLRPSTSDAENTNAAYYMDFLSNGFKLYATNAGFNGSGINYIYMAFGQSLVGSNNIPATAR